MWRTGAVMNQSGYTLAEALVGLVIVGLTVGALTQATRVLSLTEAAASRARGDDHALQTVQEGLASVLKNAGPFTAAEPIRFWGDKAGFGYACDSKSPCGAKLASVDGAARLFLSDANGRTGSVLLRNVGGARFVYSTGEVMSEVWPPDNSNQGELAKRQTLRVISLVDDTPAGEAPLATIPVWIEQAPTCDFDAISRDCRVGTP
jgi:hypothetical protein